MIFADTFYYLAVIKPRDAAHAAAFALSASITDQIVTTAWVLTEVGDALADSRDRQLFGSLLSDLHGDWQTRIIDLFDRGVRLYLSRTDKDWSLTDCISFVVMHREGITEALTGDRHFEQAGFAALLK